MRQGDSLFRPFSCLIVDAVLSSFPPEVENKLGDSRINALVYANDVFPISSTTKGTELLQEATERKTVQQGLTLNIPKCVALSIVLDAMHRMHEVPS